MFCAIDAVDTKKRIKWLKNNCIHTVWPKKHKRFSFQKRNIVALPPMAINYILKGQFAEITETHYIFLLPCSGFMQIILVPFAQI